MAPAEATAMASALALAWACDAALGEARSALHPVAWLGRLLGPIGSACSRLQPAPAFLSGAFAWLLLAASIAAGGRAIEAALATVSWPWHTLILGILLKPCFAWRMLFEEVRSVEAALARDLSAGRERIARLVSRDVRRLDAPQIRESAIETLAENLNDSLVAPVFWFAVAGLPGAMVYRFANTVDAMWGYRGTYEWAGKWAARADDVLSWIPARLTAALLRGRISFDALRGLGIEASRTPSPNGGWPMGAMALRLGVRLGKPGIYVLNPGAPPPMAGHLANALHHARRAAWAAVLAGIGACLVRAA